MPPKRKVDKEPASMDEDEEPTQAKKSRAKSKKAQEPTEPFVDELGWNIVPPSLVHRDWSSKPSKKIAAFDLDGTLVNVKSGAMFPKTADDWKFFNKSVPKKLQELHKDGYKIVIFSNQGGVKSKLDGAMATKVKERIQQFVEKVNIPAQVFFATLEDSFRKPERGMWDFMCTSGNGGLVPDLKHSFYVGDAAGRPADFAASDKEFAAAVKLPFKTPEEVFGEMEGKRAVAPPPSGGGCPDNAGLEDVFRKLVDLNAGDRFKSAAFQKVASALSHFPVAITLNNLKEVEKLPGVGKASIALMKEYLTTGKLAVLSEGAEDDAGGSKDAKAVEKPAAGGGGGAPKPAAKNIALNFM